MSQRDNRLSALRTWLGNLRLFRRKTETTLPVRAENAPKLQDVFDGKEVLKSQFGEEEVLKLEELFPLMKKCRELGIPCNDCTTLEQLRERIISHLKEVCGNSMTAVHPTLAVTKAAFDDFATRKEVFLKLVGEVQKFVADSEVRPWLDKLQISQTKDVWLEQKDFDAAVSSTEKQLTLLIAGSTSSGKSTFANVLLGEDILPTSFSSATHVLYEIKYGANKYAVLHFEHEQDGSPDRIDLTHDEGRKRFKDAVNPEREPGARINSQVSRVEVFLPNEFLKFVTLVDSPGLTEDDAYDSVVCGIGEQFQQDMACGFIYILDATRPAAEASQAGGLLRTVLSEKEDAPSPESALFIANKWDVMQQTASEDQRQEFITRSVKGIQSQWPGFKRHQLLTMNSKLAGKAQDIGWITDDMKNFTEAMKSKLARGVHFMMNKSLSRPYQLMDHIEKLLENGLRELQLPFEEMKKKRDEDRKKVEAFRTSLDREVAEAQKELNSRIDKLIPTLTKYLTSEEGYQHAFSVEKSHLSRAQQENFGKKNVDGLARQRFCDTIWRFSEIQKIGKWANAELLKNVNEATKELNMLKADVASVDTSLSFTRHQKSDSPIFPDIDLDAVPLIFALPFALIPSMEPIAGAVYAVAGSIWAFVKALFSLRTQTFQQAFEAAYKDLVQRAVANDSIILREVVLDILTVSCPSIDTLLKNIPKKMGNLLKELEARTEQEKTDIPNFQSVLEKCQKIKGEMTKFQLELNVHTYLAEDLSWPDQKEEVGFGTFGYVYKVPLPNKEYAALKEMKNPLTEDNSDKFMKELNISRTFTHRNIVKCFGTVVTSQDPLKLALLFEWCGGGTLADVIADISRPPPFKREGFQEGQRIVHEMLSGLKYIHSMGIVHGDLKPENVMMTSGREVKLGDMGSAKPVDQVHDGTHCGAYLYMAPEVLRKRPYALSADVYSLGIVLWEIWNAKRVSGSSVYKVLGNTDKKRELDDLIEAVLAGIRPDEGKFAAENDSELKSQERSKKWGDIARKCWSSVAKERPSAEEASIKIDAIE